MPCGQQSSHQRSSCGPGSCRATLLHRRTSVLHRRTAVLQRCTPVLHYRTTVLHCHTTVLHGTTMCYCATCTLLYNCAMCTLPHFWCTVHCGGRSSSLPQHFLGGAAVHLGAANANPAKKQIASDCMLFIQIQPCQ